MKIKKSEKIDVDFSRIVLIRKEQELETFIGDSGQRSYVKERLSGDRDRVLLNHLGHVEIFVSLDKDKASVHWLEVARKAGFEVHSWLCEHEVAAVSVLNGGVEPEECVAFAEGLALTNYQFLKYLSPEKAKQNALAEICLVDEGLSDDHVAKLQNLVLLLQLITKVNFLMELNLTVQLNVASHSSSALVQDKLFKDGILHSFQ